MAFTIQSKYLLPFILSAALAACGGSSDNDDTATTDSGTDNSSSSAFPSDVVVASPVDSDTAAFSGQATSTSAKPATSLRPAPTFDNAKKLVAGLLDGSKSLTGTVLDPDRLLRKPAQASCYGPRITYTDHPDESTPNTGELPGGDLGIWTETEPGTGEACTAAQLNARMSSTRDKVMTGMVGLAALVRAYETSTSNNWPDDIAAGDSEELDTALNDLGLVDFNFTVARISRDATDSNLWSYQLAFDFDDGSRTVGVELKLDHRMADATTGEMEGVMTYKIDQPNNGGNCDATTYPETTEMGSVHYMRESSGYLTIKSQAATTCGSMDTAVNLLTTTLTDVESTSSLTSAKILNPNADWADNYNIYIAYFDPETGEGAYQYAWQAGNMDSHSRLLMLNLSIDNSTSENILHGTSYFGFGDKVQDSTAPTFKGMICNWAGPGNDHTPVEAVQRQAIRQDLTDDKFKPDTTVTDAADITYAPTNSCLYDGSGTFDYDRDLDGTLGGSDDVIVTDPASTGLAYDLFQKDPADSTIMDTLINNGFSVPLH